MTGIEVTCPGVDDMWAKATLARGGWMNEIVLADLPLAANASGGLVKKGAGRLVLNTANTFAKPIEVAGALPAIHVPGSGTWRVFARGHELKLGLQKGTMLILR